MIEIPRLTKINLEQIRDKKIIVCGEFHLFNIVYEILDIFNISVAVFCVSANISSRKHKCHSVPVIAQAELKHFLLQNRNVLVIQDSVINLNDFHLKCSEIADFSLDELINSFKILLFLRKTENRLGYLTEKFYWMLDSMRKINIEMFSLRLRNVKHPLIVCLPMKTADVSLYYTFDSINNVNGNYIKKLRFKKSLQHKFLKFLFYIKQAFSHVERPIEYANVIHKPKLIDEKRRSKFKTIKIITGVRDPIAQNLSCLYQELSTLDDFSNWLFGELENKSRLEQQALVANYKNHIMEDNNNVQVWFDLMIDRYIYPKDGYWKKSTHIRSIQEFYAQFSSCILDITKYPFDKEKGYTIIKAGKIEVFVYQLEKLNDLIPELSQWVGVPFNKLENGNQASEKWIGESYKAAQKGIEITQEYFNKCFDESYVNHCYSKADIEKFKAKWKAHVKS